MRFLTFRILTYRASFSLAILPLWLKSIFAVVVIRVSIFIGKRLNTFWMFAVKVLLLILLNFLLRSYFTLTLMCLRHLLLFHFVLLALVRHNLCLLCSLLNLRVCLLYLLAISSVFITTVATQMGIKILLQKVFSTFRTVDALSENLFSHFFFSHFCSATVTLEHLLLFVVLLYIIKEIVTVTGQ